MKKTCLLSLVLSMFLLNSFAQSKEELTGTWTVNKVTAATGLPGETEKETAEGTKKMEEAFLNSTFQLNADGTCKIGIVETMAKKEGIKAGKLTWVYNEIDKSIMVFEGSGKQKDNMMKFYVRKEGKKWKFIESEMKIILDVKKGK